MFIKKSIYIIPIFIFVAGLTAVSCSSQISNANISNTVAVTNSNSETGVTTKEDTAELGSLILLPIIPEETLFREENDVNNPSIKKLTAVLKFSSEDAKNLVAQAEKHRPAETVHISIEGWFPEELVAQAQMSGDVTLTGTAYGANDFMQMPYKTGRLVKIENSDYFILEFSSN